MIPKRVASPSRCGCLKLHLRDRFELGDFLLDGGEPRNLVLSESGQADIMAGCLKFLQHADEADLVDVGQLGEMVVKRAIPCKAASRADVRVSVLVEGKRKSMGHRLFSLGRKNPALPVDLLTHNNIKRFLHTLPTLVAYRYHRGRIVKLFFGSVLFGCWCLCPRGPALDRCRPKPADSLAEFDAHSLRSVGHTYLFSLGAKSVLIHPFTLDIHIVGGKPSSKKLQDSQSETVGGGARSSGSIPPTPESWPDSGQRTRDT